MILMDVNENSHLMLLLEDFFDSAMVCVCIKGSERLLLLDKKTMVHSLLLK